MFIGVPRESHRHENRVGLTPRAVARLCELGHTVLVQRDAGVGARFSDPEYEAAGAQIVYSAEEAYRRADLVCQLGRLSAAELDLLKPDSTICAFHHLAVAPAEVLRGLMERRITAIAYELIEDETGDRPVLIPFSEMAGKMAVHLGAFYLQNVAGGRGILLGDVPGIAPPTVVVLGAGTAGRAATGQALASGAHVVVLDNDMRKLRDVNNAFGGQVVTAHAGLDSLGRYTSVADVLIGAVLIPGARAPILVTEEMVRGMRPGTVILDLSIDQGGCVETSRPTTLDRPTFLLHDVVHYCVPNMTAGVARTASRALARATLHWLLALTERGVPGALRVDPGLAAGVVLYRGRLVKPRVAATVGLPVDELEALLDEEEREGS